MRLTPTQAKPVRTPAVCAGGQQRRIDTCAKIFFDFLFTSGLYLNKTDIKVCTVYGTCADACTRDPSQRVAEQFCNPLWVMLRTIRAITIATVKKFLKDAANPIFFLPEFSNVT